MGSEGLYGRCRIEGLYIRVLLFCTIFFIFYLAGCYRVQQKFLPIGVAKSVSRLPVFRFKYHQTNTKHDLFFFYVSLAIWKLIFELFLFLLKWPAYAEVAD